MSEPNVFEECLGASLSEECPTSPPIAVTILRKRHLSAIRALLQDMAVRDEARKSRRAAASAVARENIRFAHLQERYGWTREVFSEYLALQRWDREKWLDRERKRVKAPARKNANVKDMSPAHRERHRTEQNRLAQQRRRAKLAGNPSAGVLLLGDEELAILLHLETQGQTEAQGEAQVSGLDEALLEELWAARAAQMEADRSE